MFLKYSEKELKIIRYRYFMLLTLTIKNTVVIF